jgi:hypothetical protein
VKVAATAHPRRGGALHPTAAQAKKARAVMSWYLGLYHGRPWNLGTLTTFGDPARVGHFSVAPGAVRREEPASLFRLLIAVTVFQRRQDQQVLRILRGMSRPQVQDLTTRARLLMLCDTSRCEHLRSTAALHKRCDLSKDPRTKQGMCEANPTISCHLKRHTVLLKRYGHFGKVPSSAALTLREFGATDVRSLRREVWRREADPAARAVALESALMGTWRVSRKIAAMYLSMLSTPGLTHAPPVWRDVDWTRFVVIDSNTDLFLRALGYEGPWTYDARRAFITQLARRVDARAGRGDGPAANPRVLQQAMYAFMSTSNRRATREDCAHAPGACDACPPTLRTLCPLATGRAPRSVALVRRPSRGSGAR